MGNPRMRPVDFHSGLLYVSTTNRSNRFERLHHALQPFLIFRLTFRSIVVRPVKNAERSLSRIIEMKRIRDVSVRHIEGHGNKTQTKLDLIEHQRIDASITQRLGKMPE